MRVDKAHNFRNLPVPGVRKSLASPLPLPVQSGDKNQQLYKKQTGICITPRLVGIAFLQHFVKNGLHPRLLVDIEAKERNIAEHFKQIQF